ncbi:Clan CA, family C1, cathepsin L-like cysteine peptidase [Tritrichomonas foetus]|uniref:Clan CA, family C1, cathepsin L-like cysteine peptidase n=1 Tax=Tritrichomonas foetus TaxID=1144522 RepID=A0A1J4KFK3_9EUKA|nr:Clan CA, family C1, cathepsin L-like cysteine peptidase [Tritrichomonas foetus]|eukprot:OHT08398.1 Clan CA, family C1, cathepsin L-like cysteine peptidase [Tritrichomonas foetus]
MLSLLLSLVECTYYMPFEEKSFLSWMRNTNQFYVGNEYQLRFGIFLSNARYVQEHNAGDSKFTVSLNKFAALTPSEYKVMLGYKTGMKAEKVSRGMKKPNVDSIDWREKGVVNEIKDQAACGSCWAFSAIQAAESAYAISTGTLESYSEQNLVDCVQGCYGCSGGLMDYAYKYIIDRQKGKMILESDYVYTALDGVCKFAQFQTVGNVASFLYIAENDEEDLAANVETHGPVAVAIDASHQSFQLYKSGIYDEPECSATFLNHGVGCIGFGSDNDTKYWIVRNSWGLTWGEEGYIRIIRKDNRCGIAASACFPLA